MKKRICLFLLALSLLLTACGPSARTDPDPAPEDPAPEASSGSQPAASEPETVTLMGVEITEETSERERGWLKDLDTLQKDFERRHPKPYYRCSKEEFVWKLEQLAGRIQTLSDSDLYFELSAIVAAMDDGIHTSVVTPPFLFDRCFPVYIYCFEGKAYLWSYAEKYEQFAPFLMHEIVAVNGVDMSYILRKAESFLNPGNKWNAMSFYEMNFAPCAAFYDWAGCGYKEGYTFQFLNDSREVVSVEVPTLPYEEVIELITSNSYAHVENIGLFSALKAKASENWTEYFDGANGGCVYVAFGDVRTEEQANYQGTLSAEAARLAAEHPECRKLVIDLRGNGGGYVGRLKYFQKNMEALKASSIQQTYVLTGGYSMSAATYCASFFKGEMDAVLVGEPMGEFISFYAGSTDTYQQPPILLPYSQLSVEVAAAWRDWEKDREQFGYNEWGQWARLAEEYYDEDGDLYDWETTVLPDVFVSQTAEDARQGKDSLLEWVFAQ